MRLMDRLAMTLALRRAYQYSWLYAWRIAGSRIAQSRRFDAQNFWI